MFLFLHIHPWVCMFSVNNVPCRGHSLSGPWGCEALANSAVMKPLVRKPSPWLLGSMGTVSYRFCRKGSSSWWGLWAPGPSPWLIGGCLLHVYSYGSSLFACVQIPAFFCKGTYYTVLCLLSCCSRVWLFVMPWTVAARVLCPWDSPGKNTAMGGHFFLQILD